MNPIFRAYQRALSGHEIFSILTGSICILGDKFAEKYFRLSKYSKPVSSRISPMPGTIFQQVSNDGNFNSIENPLWLSFHQLEDEKFQWRIGLSKGESPVKSRPLLVPRWPWDIGGWSCKKLDSFIAPPTFWLDRSLYVNNWLPGPVSGKYIISQTEESETLIQPLVYHWRLAIEYKEEARVQSIAIDDGSFHGPYQQSLLYEPTDPYQNPPSIYARFLLVADTSLDRYHLITPAELSILCDEEHAHWVISASDDKDGGITYHPVALSESMGLDSLKWPWEVKFASWTNGDEPTSFEIQVFENPILSNPS